MWEYDRVRSWAISWLFGWIGMKTSGDCWSYGRKKQTSPALLKLPFAVG